MRHSSRRFLASALVLAALALAPPARGQSLSTAFTYQGLIRKDGVPYTGTCDFTFSLWTTAGAGSPPVGGSQVGGNVVRNAVPVSVGVFTTSVDFGGGIFQGDARWLQIAAVCPAGGAATTLAPRVSVLPAPYALALPGLSTQTGGSSPNVVGGHPNNSTGAAIGATISGGGSSGTPNLVTDNYGTVGGGQDNQAGDNAGSVLDAAYAVVAGGRQNDALGTYSAIGGGFSNSTMGLYATISGGSENEADLEYATVGGGRSNNAEVNYATIGGGDDNAVGTTGGTIAGGRSNNAGGWGFVGGGEDNNAGSYGVVGGGSNNSAIGGNSVVPGGEGNTASGSHSFAAGRNASATHTGSFVWADSTDLPFGSSSEDSVRFRATGGGVRMVLAVDGTGAYTWSCVVSSGNSWSCSSDRDQKENLESVDGGDVLERLARLPIYTWNGKGTDPGVKHMGPTSQDFLASFGLGDDEKLISTIDLDGVALAAIQGLARRVEEERAEVARLRERLDAMERALAGSAVPFNH